MSALLRGERRKALAVVLAAAWVAIYQARIGGVKGKEGSGAVPDVLLTLGMCAVLFGVCGYGAARLLLPQAWRAHFWLLVGPVGAATSTLSLTILGLAHVPLKASLAIVLASFAVLDLAAWRRARPLGQPPGDRVVAVGAPLALALLVAAISLVPVFRAGFATVPGQNGDAVLAVGTANLLQHAPPTAVRPELPLDRVPLQWRSKLPIYYGLAAVSELAGQPTYAAFPTVSAVVLAMFALGLFLVVLEGLRAPPLVALAALFVVPLDRIVTYVAIHPYYNQLWGMFALPFVLLSGWWFLREPSRRALALALMFLALALFAYPLLLPFPAGFLAAVAFHRRARAREWAAALRLPRWVWIAAAIVAVPVVAVLVRGVAEKVWSAVRALAPGGDLSGWAGGAFLPYFPFGRFLGDATLPVVVLICALALLALRRLRGSEFAFGTAVMLAGAIAAGVYVRARGHGELFWFKDLAFAGPLIVALAVVALGAATGRALRIGAAVLGALLALTMFAGTQQEIHDTFEQVPRDMLALRDWDRRLPPGSSIRIDVAPSGWQMWAWYFLSDHPVSASRPLTGFFPHPPFGKTADYALTHQAPEEGPLPKDLIRPPVFRNGLYTLWRLKPGKAPDTSSRALVYDITKITF